MFSAGVRPSTIHPLTIRVLEEAGFDVKRHEAKGIKGFLGRLQVHYLIIVCSNAERECPTTFPGMLERLVWPLEDPAAARGTDEQRIAAFRKVRDQIEQRVRTWAPEFP